jgi:hypothetical protein
VAALLAASDGNSKWGEEKRKEKTKRKEERERDKKSQK